VNRDESRVASQRGEMAKSGDHSYFVRSTRGHELRAPTRQTLEFAIDLWHRFKGRPMSRRAGYLIVAAVALETDVPQLIVHGLFKAFGIDVPILESPHWVSVVFVGLAVALLVADRFLPESTSIPRPNPHDVDLFRRFRELFDDDTMFFLRTHDCRSSFEAKYFKVFNEISAVWVGSRYQFDDTEMSAIWEDLFPRDRELARLIAYNTTPAQRNMDWLQPYWVHEDSHSPETERKVKLMNETATELAQLVDRLETVARRKWISVPSE
jgi:hypothetical protein